MILQLRKAMQSKMDTTIRINRPDPVDDGFGGKMPGTVERWVTIRAKITRKNSGPMTLSPVPSGMDSGGFFILTDHLSEIREGDAFPGYRIGPVDRIVQFGALIGYQAPLIPA